MTGSALTQNSSVGRRPIFVVGAPRTGTTLAMRILNLHSSVHIYNEVHYHERVVDVLGDKEELNKEELGTAVNILLKHCPWTPGSGNLQADVAKLVQSIEADQEISHRRVFEQFLSSEAQAHDSTIWGDSSPQDCLYMQSLLRWYPDAVFLGIIRDPRAYLASYKNYYRKEIVTYRNRFNAFTNSLLWRTYMNAVLDFYENAGAERVMLLKYEDLVLNPEKKIRDLCRFLDLPFQEEMLAVASRNSSYFNVNQDGEHKGISSESLDRWRTELLPDEIWTVEKLCGSTMSRLDYEPIIQRLSPRMLPGLLKTTAMMPGRLINLLFRTNKPFTLAKVRHVLNRLG